MLKDSYSFLSAADKRFEEIVILCRYFKKQLMAVSNFAVPTVWSFVLFEHAYLKLRNSHTQKGYFIEKEKSHTVYSLFAVKSKVQMSGII